MITFEVIRYKNFLSTGNAFTEVQIDSHNLTVLLGGSGSGKSTLLDAISFVLYNKPFRDINKGQLVNAINQKDCMVEIEFSTMGKKFLVRRGIKPNIFEIFKEGELINQDSASRDYQKYLEEQVLRCSNYKTFCQIVLLGAASFVPFMRLKPADRRTIIEELLDIQVFSTMNTLLKDRISEHKERTKDNDLELKYSEIAIQNQIELIKKLTDGKKLQIENLAKKVDEKKKAIINLKLELAEFEVGIESIELEKIQENLEEFDTKIQSFQKKENILKSDLQKKESDFKQNQQNLRHENQTTLVQLEVDYDKNLRNKTSELQSKIERLSSEKVFKRKEILGKFELREQELRKTIKFYSSDATECPVCSNKMSEEGKKKTVAEAQAELDRLSKETIKDRDFHDLNYTTSIKVLESEKKDITQILEDEYNQQVTKIKEEFELAQTEIKQKYESSVEQVKLGLKKIEEILEKLNLDRRELASKRSDHERKQRLKDNKVMQIATEMKVLCEFEEELEEMKAEATDFGSEESKLSELKLKHSTSLSDRDSLLIEKQNLDVVSTLLKDSGIKTRVIKQYIPVINSAVNKYLAAMNFFVTFELNEEFEERIRSRGRDDFSYCNFSEGERQRIDMALLFAWRTLAKVKNSVNTNLLILDEVLDSSLDDESTVNAIHLLRREVFKDANVFVITHKPQMADKFDRVINYEKKDNFSAQTNE